MAGHDTETTWDRLDLLVCPTCHGHLRHDRRELRCAECDTAYAITDGVPRMVDWAELSAAGRQEMAGQDRHFGELTDKAVFKPDFHPRYRRRRMEERLGHLRAALAEGLPEKGSVHVACCGTGYEVEALANAGYQVSASDLSAQALRGLAKRAAARGYQVPYVQADVLHLPFPEDSFDLAVVVAGLHHTPDPAAGFAELVRVTRRRLVIIEPYTGALFNLLGRLRLAHRREYSHIQPTRLSAARLRGMVHGDYLRVRQRRLYLDLPPGPVSDWLGESQVGAVLLSSITWGAERVLRSLGVGNSVLLSVDLV